MYYNSTKTPPGLLFLFIKPFFLFDFVYSKGSILSVSFIYFGYKRHRRDSIDARPKEFLCQSNQLCFTSSRERGQNANVTLNGLVDCTVCC